MPAGSALLESNDSSAFPPAATASALATAEPPVLTADADAKAEAESFLASEPVRAAQIRRANSGIAGLMVGAAMAVDMAGSVRGGSFCLLIRIGTV